MRIRDFRPTAAVGDVKSIDGRAFLGADARQHNARALLAKRSQQIVKKSDPIGRFDLDQRVSWMRLVVDRDSDWEIEFVRPACLNFLPRLFEQRREFKVLHFKRAPDRVFNQCAITYVRHRMSLDVTNAKQAEHRVVFARENVGTDNIKWNHRKRTRDFREELLAVPGAK